MSLDSKNIPLICETIEEKIILSTETGRRLGTWDVRENKSAVFQVDKVLAIAHKAGNLAVAANGGQAGQRFRQMCVENRP